MGLMGFDPLQESICISVKEKMEKGNLLPIQVVNVLEREYKRYGAHRVDIQREVSDYLYAKKEFEYCEKIGHDIVDNSYGGPEGGCIDYYCKKCGFSVHQILY